MTAESPTYVLVDGENIDATLGISILGRRPQPAERPRWERVLQFAGGNADGDTHGLFFLDEGHRQVRDRKSVV